MNKQEDLLAKVDKLFTMYVTEELHVYILADLINFIGVSAHEKAKGISEVVDRKSKKFKAFRNRTIALDNIRRESNKFISSIESDVKKAFSVEDFDEQAGAISDHMKALFSMSPEQIHMLLLATKMIKSGKIPTYFDMSTLEKQEIAKRANIPAEHVFKVFQHIPDICIDPKQISIFDVGV